MTGTATTLRFGVNYTPRRGWFHSWQDFDPDAAAEDLAQIAELGLDHVRVFHLWPLLQPNRSLIRPRGIEQLVKLVDLAAEQGLDVLVDGVQGHLSSFDFYPEWTRAWHHRNIFTEPGAIAAQAELLRTLGRALAGRPNLIGLQLGNELNNLVRDNPATPQQIDNYLDTLLAATREGLAADPRELLSLHSAYDAAWYGDDHPFTPEASARKGDLTVVHPWVMSGNCLKPLRAAVAAGAALGRVRDRGSPRPTRRTPTDWYGFRRPVRPSRSSRPPTHRTSPAALSAEPRTAPACGG